MIRVQHLSKAFGERTVLNDISLEVGKGQIMAVMGTSGGGKTTLLKCISGLIEPDAGTAEVAGVNVQRDPEAARRKMGLVFQSAALFDYMDVRENVLFGPRRWLNLSAKDEEALLDETLDAVGLTGNEHLMPGELSGGMRKRVGIARALAMKPEVMLYDEPTTGLDPVTAYTVDGLVAEVRKLYGVTSIVVSHDLTSVVRVADRIAFLDGGKLSFEGTASEFRDSRLPGIVELVSKSEAEHLA